MVKGGDDEMLSENTDLLFQARTELLSELLLAVQRENNTCQKETNFVATGSADVCHFYMKAPT